MGKRVFCATERKKLNNQFYIAHTRRMSKKVTLNDTKRKINNKIKSHQNRNISFGNSHWTCKLIIFMFKKRFLLFF